MDYRAFMRKIKGRTRSTRHRTSVTGFFGFAKGHRRTLVIKRLASNWSATARGSALVQALNINILNFNKINIGYIDDSE